ncbi:hypothetical protein FDECE_13857 [Fusarium decemcellulare]|nr:hypothetical protein FDECE_13857 [Fusarium decemcellulare]
MSDEQDFSDDSSRRSGSVTSRKCPHDQIVGSRFGTYVPIRTCLKYSATCLECQVLLQAIEAFQPGWIDAHKGGDGLIQVEDLTVYKVTLLLGPRFEEAKSYLADAREITSFQFFHRSKAEPLYEEEPDWYSSEPYNKLRNPRAQSLDVVEESFSQTAFDRAAKWLSHCLEQDEACSLPSQDFMPRHLIDVGSWDGSREPFLFKPCQPAPYACLSYCWGSDTDDILKTTTKNISSHYLSIPMTKMPLGIQDAITVCRGLKIPNLWVDSLCIPQDDDIAWLEDASQMDQIYLYSHLTIAALEPASCKSRFLGKQRFGHPEWQRRFVADVPQANDEAPLEIFVRPAVEVDGDLEKKSSLDKRGWCLQESLLPNRRLCFNGDEMIWECLCRKICECGHILWRPQPFRFARLATSLKASRLKAEVKSSHPLPAITFRQERERHLGRPKPYYPTKSHQRWRDIVTEYSKRSVSRRKDKLNAVSGLAKLVRENLEGNRQDQDGEPAEAEEYFAGLWKQEFHFDLAWKVENSNSGAICEEFANTSTHDKPEIGHDCGIPSWSWASVDGPISYDVDDPLKSWKYAPRLLHCVEIETVSCQREFEDDETSAVISGQAVLTGSRVPVKLSKGPIIAGGSTVFVRSENSNSVEVTLDGLKGVTTNELYCFRLFSWEAFTGRFNSDGSPMNMGPETWFLILRPSISTRGAFERVGAGSSDSCALFEHGEIVTIKIV